MAEIDLRSADYTENKQIPNGLPGEVMRKSMENKNILTRKGSLYVGTGTVDEVKILGDNYLIAQTGELLPGSNNAVLVADSTQPMGLSYKNVEDIIGGVVRYDISQGLNVSQKTQARTNIGAAKEFTAGTGLAFTNNSLSLKVATKSAIGGVKIGDGLNVNSNNSLYLKTATTSTIGGVKIGDGLSVGTDGVLSLPVSANGDLGGIKVSVVSSLPTTLADDVFYFVTT